MALGGTMMMYLTLLCPYLKPLRTLPCKAREGRLSKWQWLFEFVGVLAVYFSNVLVKVTCDPRSFLLLLSVQGSGN